MKSIVSEKGQVTLPKALRSRLGIRPGQVLEFRAERGTLIATKVESVDPIDAVYGVLGRRGTSADEIVQKLRGTPDAT